MTRVDTFLFKNSLKVILKLVEAPVLDDTGKARLKAEIDAMIKVLDRFTLK